MCFIPCSFSLHLISRSISCSIVISALNPGCCVKWHLPGLRQFLLCQRRRDYWPAPFSYKWHMLEHAVGPCTCTVQYGTFIRCLVFVNQVSFDAEHVNTERYSINQVPLVTLVKDYVRPLWVTGQYLTQAFATQIRRLIYWEKTNKCTMLRQHLIFSHKIHFYESTLTTTCILYVTRVNIWQCLLELWSGQTWSK